MAEHLHPREPDAPAETGTTRDAQKPVLSRYARRAQARERAESTVDADAEPNPQPAVAARGGDAAPDPEPTARALSEAAHDSSDAADAPEADAGQPIGAGEASEGVEVSARSAELPAPPEVARNQSQERREEPDATEPTRDALGATAPHVAEPAPSAPDEGVRRVVASEVDDAPVAESSWASQVVPVRGGPAAGHAGSGPGGSGKKLPFWKRIALPLVQGTPGASPAEGATPRATNLEPVLARLSALEKQLAANQVATESQLTRFEENITRLWELEEQLTLTEVRERLALLEANQEEVADGLHTVARNLTLLAVVLAAALAAGLLSLGLLL